MCEVVISPEAARSLQDIDDYTAAQFGPRQAIRYLESLIERLDYLAEDPKRGKKRDDLDMDLYSYFVGSHTIYYQISADHIEIIDILHQSMEPSKHIHE